MFLFSRFKEIFSKDFWAKSKNISMSSSIGFFVFWMLVLSVIGSLLSMNRLNVITSELVDDFRRDFVEFEVKMEDGVLSTKNIPDPFVLSKFLEEDGAAGYDLGIDEEILQEFKQGFREGLSEEFKVDGQKIEGEDLELVLDTKGELGLTVETIPQDKLGFYFLATEMIGFDPTGLEDGEKFAVESYEEIEDFKFDKEFVISNWDKISGKVNLIFGGIAFSAMIVLLILLRFVSNIWWGLLVVLVGSVMGHKFEFFEAYGVTLNYLVPVTLIELAIIFTFGWVPFLTLALMLVFAIGHGVSAQKNDEAKVEVSVK